METLITIIISSIISVFISVIVFNYKEIYLKRLNNLEKLMLSSYDFKKNIAAYISSNTEEIRAEFFRIQEEFRRSFIPVSFYFPKELVEKVNKVFYAGIGSFRDGDLHNFDTLMSQLNDDIRKLIKINPLSFC